MSRSIPAKQLRLAAQAGEIAFAAPQVMARRFREMMFLAPGDRHRAMRGFSAEKVRTAQEAAVSYAQAWWKAWFGFWFPWTPGRAQHAALDMMGKGMAPVRRRVLANAKVSRRAKRR